MFVESGGVACVEGAKVDILFHNFGDDQDQVQVLQYKDGHVLDYDTYVAEAGSSNYWTILDVAPGVGTLVVLTSDDVDWGLVQYSGSMPEHRDGWTAD